MLCSGCAVLPGGVLLCSGLEPKRRKCLRRGGWINLVEVLPLLICCRSMVSKQSTVLTLNITEVFDSCLHYCRLLTSQYISLSPPQVFLKIFVQGCSDNSKQDSNNGVQCHQYSTINNILTSTRYDRYPLWVSQSLYHHGAGCRLADIIKISCNEYIVSKSSQNSYLG